MPRIAMLGAAATLVIFGCGNAASTNDAAKSVSQGGDASTSIPEVAGEGGGGVSGEDDNDNDPPTPGSFIACGGELGDSCLPNEFCFFDTLTHCGSTGETGTCRLICQPTAGNRYCGCDVLSDYPVCGCDGKPYHNQCFAQVHGTSEDIERSSGYACQRFCGRPEDAPCAAGEYCYYSPQQACGQTETTGVCLGTPTDDCVSAPDSPACGCDAKTYSSSCAAGLAGVSVAHEGACE